MLVTGNKMVLKGSADSEYRVVTVKDANCGGGYGADMLHIANVMTVGKSGYCGYVPNTRGTSYLSLPISEELVFAGNYENSECEQKSNFASAYETMNAENWEERCRKIIA